MGIYAYTRSDTQLILGVKNKYMSHIVMYLPIYLPTHPYINLPMYLPTKPPTYLLIYLLNYPPSTHPFTYPPT
jgi:hypothetical protein